MKWPIFAVLTIVASVAGAPRDAWAWGDEGHKVVCEIAMRLVQSSTRAEVKKLISTTTGSTPSVIPAHGQIIRGREQASTF
jgi:hypothetical protein